MFLDLPGFVPERAGTINPDGLAADIRRCRREQECYDGCNLAFAAHAPERQIALAQFEKWTILFPIGFQAARLDDAGGDGVDPYAPMRPFNGQRAGEIFDARPRRARMDHAGEAAPVVHEHVDDGSPVLAHITVVRLLAHKKGAGQICLYHRTPAFRRDILGGTKILAATVVKEAMHRSMLADHRLEERADLLLVPNIADAN